MGTDPSSSTTISHYRLEQRLGGGGMGDVYIATDLQHNTRVALKLMRPEIANDPAFQERFESEAHLAALLRSPYTVRLLDYGVANGTYFLVMDYIEGEDLSSIIKREGPLPLDRTLRIAVRVARALEHAEAAGVTHRDIKPGNVLVNTGDTVKVTDFGIARQAGSTLTQTGSGLGTPGYAAPEQWQGQADHRSDIYSTGVLIYTMLHGRMPDFTDLGAAMERIPPEARPIVMRCLQPNPAHRYQRASELAAALQNARRAVSGEEPTPAAAATPSGALRMALQQSSQSRLSGATAFNLVVENPTNNPISADLRAAAGTADLQMPQGLVLAPGESRTISVVAKPRKRRWFGNGGQQSFAVAAAAGDGTVLASANGSYEERSTPWLPIGGGALCVGIVVVVIMMLLGGGGGGDDEDPGILSSDDREATATAEEEESGSGDGSDGSDGEDDETPTEEEAEDTPTEEEVPTEDVPVEPVLTERALDASLFPRAVRYSNVNWSLLSATISNADPYYFGDRDPVLSEQTYAFLELRLVDDLLAFQYWDDSIWHLIAPDGTDIPGASNAVSFTTEAARSYPVTVFFPVEPDFPLEEAILVLQEPGRVPAVIPISGELPANPYPITVEATGEAVGDPDFIADDVTMRAVLLGGTLDIDGGHPNAYTGDPSYYNRRAEANTRYLDLQLQVTIEGAYGNTFCGQELLLIVDGVRTGSWTGPNDTTCHYLEPGIPMDVAISWLIPTSAQAVALQVGNPSGRTQQIPITLPAMPPVEGE